MAELVAGGQGALPRAVGGGAETLRRAARVHPIAALQTRVLAVDAATRRTASSTPAASWASASWPTARSAAASSPGRSSASRTSPTDDFRRHSPRFQGENFQKNLDLVDAASRSSRREKGCTPAQLALAWVLAQGDDIVPIPGTKRRKYLEENVGAVDVQLTPEDLRRIDDDRAQGRRRRDALPGSGDGRGQPLTAPSSSSSPRPDGSTHTRPSRATRKWAASGPQLPAG